MSRIVLPVIAFVLVALAAAGVVLGLRVQRGEASLPGDGGSDVSAAPGDGEAAAPAQGEGERSPPGAAPASPRTPASLVRFGVTEAPAKREGTIRLATYNVENLFDGVDDPALSGRYEDIDDEKPEAELVAVAAAIRALDADVLALQEIESEAVITGFRDTYLSDMGYEHLASIDAGDERGIEQAVLSRFPITKVENWPRRELGGVHPEQWGDDVNYNAGAPIRFHRSPLRVDVEAPGTVTGGEPYGLTLYVVHAKSGGPGEYWRQAEAAALTEIIRAQLAAEPLANIAVIGDFNALLNDRSVQWIVWTGFHDALGASGVPGPAFVTHESGRKIDHILAHQNLLPEIVPGSGFVLGTPALPEGLDWRESWRPEGYASDHYPVAVDIRPLDRASD